MYSKSQLPGARSFVKFKLGHKSAPRNTIFNAVVPGRSKVSEVVPILFVYFVVAPLILFSPSYLPCHIFDSQFLVKLPSWNMENSSSPLNRTLWVSLKGFLWFGNDDTFLPHPSFFSVFLIDTNNNNPNFFNQPLFIVKRCRINTVF
ncbi:hypothetical protein BofuT4_P000230.1 [Botrytis cinerea T4]|uniref:Uncharacterized protein n=1 Tax=Botryotinia fuckeliana (strain T4) TaxID=999810 RepID=G2YLS8_BOTF4|nr:hypothetical protein BofuT4_P000230.1 [Botrytis cinerea T4]